MLAGTHIIFGAAIYRLAEDKPLWVKVPAVLVGGFFSHFLLDSMATYHRLRGDEWSFVYTLIQILAVLILWGNEVRRAKHRWDIVLPPAILSGLWAFLSWDWERLIDKNYIHFARAWMPRYFGDCSSNPWTGLWEVALAVGLIALLWPRRSETEWCS